MQDVRLAFRNLVRRPGFSIIAVITMALGIGANAAVFTVSRAVLLAPLPYTDPGAIVILNETTPQFPSGSVTRYNYDDWRTRATSFAAMGAFRPLNMTVTGGTDPERVPVKMITASLLPLLGVNPVKGRNFSDAEDRAGAADVAIVTAGFARRRFGGDDPVGRALQLDSKPHTVVGVLPANFELFSAADVYVPFGPWAATLPEDRGWHPGIFPVARLKPGVSLEAARVEMDGISKQLEAEFSDSNRNVRALVNRVQDQIVQNVRPALLMLTGAVALLLLIACANVANLLLARAVDRQKELAVRIALGASRARIVRQLIVESVVLALAGSIAGIFVATWAISLLSATTVTGLPRSQNIAMDWTIVLFALGLAAVTGIIFGLAPALHATQVPVQQSLNEEGRGSSGSSRQRRIRSALVVAEVGLALVLLVGAGLLLRSFQTLTQIDPGFDPQNMLVVNVPLSPQKYRDAALRGATVERVVARVKALPGVRNAAMTTSLPMSGAGATIHFNRKAYPPKGPDEYVTTGYRAATPDYLSTLGVQLLRGRLLAGSDRGGAPLVAVINESMARTYFPDREALGERIQLGTEPDPDAPWMEIVGVVSDVKQSFEAGAKAEMFLPYVQFPAPILTNLYLNTALVVRTDGNPDDLATSVRAAMREIDPGQPLVNLRTMEQSIGATVAQPRLQMTLLLVFAVLALVLAAVGVYGVISYTVSQRIPEIGVRMAVGASPPQVTRMVVSQAAVLTAKGLGLGLAAGFIAAGAMRSLLFQTNWLDPVTFAVAPVVLGAAALLASYIPARRAARVSPVVALQK